MAWGFSCFKFQRYEVAVYRVRGVLSYWEIRKRLERRPFCSFPSCHFTFLSDISRFSLTFHVSLWHLMFLSDISCFSLTFHVSLWHFMFVWQKTFAQNVIPPLWAFRQYINLVTFFTRISTLPTLLEMWKNAHFNLKNCLSIFQWN